MSVRASLIRQGASLEGLTVFGPLDSLPYSLDSPVWAGAMYWSLSGTDDAAVGVNPPFAMIWRPVFAIPVDAPAREGMEITLAGHDWITRPV